MSGRIWSCSNAYASNRRRCYEKQTHYLSMLLSFWPICGTLASTHSAVLFAERVFLAAILLLDLTLSTSELKGHNKHRYIIQSHVSFDLE